MGKREEKIKKNKEMMIEALRKSWGIVSVACQMVGISRQTHYDYLNRDEEYQKIVEEIEEAQIDFVESKLLDNISQGKEQSIKFYLATKGRKRGYHSPKHTLDDYHPDELPGSEPDKTVIIIPHNNRDDQKFLDTGEQQYDDSKN